MPHYPDEIEYSDKYQDDSFEYRHVILPKRVAKEMFKLFQLIDFSAKGGPSKAGEPRLLSENEWRSIGVQQSRGWQHYEIHKPEPHILLFRRPLGTNPVTGVVESAAGGSTKAA
jgi:cyclin-dependent kinase regulatory subunit CKS1